MKTVRNILVIITMALMAWAANAQTGLRFPKKEYLTAKLHAHYHFKETDANYKGLNYALEAGYTGKVYVLLGFESFSSLKGGEINGEPLKGYTSFNGAVGLNLTHGLWEQWNYNAGVRLVRAYRGPINKGHYRYFIGWEGGIAYQFDNNLGIGIRATYDYRNDQEIFDWTPEYKFSSFITITYRIKQL